MQYSLWKYTEEIEKSISNKTKSLNCTTTDINSYNILDNFLLVFSVHIYILQGNNIVLSYSVICEHFLRSIDTLWEYDFLTDLRLWVHLSTPFGAFVTIPSIILANLGI